MEVCSAPNPMLPKIFWLMAIIAIPIWAAVQSPAPGWDLHVYVNAIHALNAGHDPYVDGMGVQRAFHLTPAARNPDIMPPYTYVYSPLTLPLLRVIGHLPLRLLGVLYWSLYAIAIVAVVWAMMFAIAPKERPLFSLLAPAAVFFPGLLQADTILSGNVVFIFYGFIFAGAVLGWRRNRWLAFYIAVLLASCCKAPLLTLLGIPVFSARRQWIPASFVAAAGLALFAIQPLIWPTLFHNYLQAVELQFSYNHDFGMSPSGLLGSALFALGLPYYLASAAFYCIYVIPVFGSLLYLSRRFFAGRTSLTQWIPVLLLGVVLLNPRIKEYDIAPMTLPLALVMWRLSSRADTLRQSVVIMSVLFMVVNVAGNVIGALWQPIEGTLLAGLFAAGCWNLMHPVPQHRTVDLEAETHERLSPMST